MARFGPEAALPDVLMALASCERRRDLPVCSFSNPHEQRRDRLEVARVDELLPSRTEAARSLFEGRRA